MSRSSLRITFCATVVVIASTSSPLLAQDAMDGRWILFAADGEAETIATVAGTTISFENLEPGAPPAPPLTRAPDSTEPPYRWLTPDRAGMVFTFADPGGEYLVVSIVGEEEHLLGYRLGASPAELNGLWALRVPDDEAEIIVTIDPAAGTVAAAMDGETRTGTFEGIAAPDPHLYALLSLGAPGQRMVFRFTEIGPEVYFMMPVDDPEQGVLYRPGARPPWLDALMPHQSPLVPAPPAP